MVKEQKMSWYVIKTQSNKERSVVEKLNLEMSRSSIQDKVGRIVIPTEKEVQIKDGKRVFREKITMPGYVFIQTGAIGELTHILKNINGTSGFLRTKDGNPQTMKDIDVAKMLNEQELVDSKELNSSFILNEEVKIIDGPFASFKGNVEFVDKDRNKIRVSVSIFGKKTMLDLHLLQVEKVEN